MKKIGIIILLIGLVGLALVMGMDTSVATGHGDDRVHNIGLMSEKQNYLFVAIAFAVVGAVLLAIGVKTEASLSFWNPTDANRQSRACPYCAEQIKVKAVVCRFCGKDVEALPNAASGSGIASPEQSHFDGVSPLQLIARFGKRKLMYLTAALVLGALAATVVMKLREPPEPLFLSIENVVTFLADPGGDKVAQISVTLHARDTETAQIVKIMLPSIREGLLMRLSGKTSEQLLAPGAKEKLANEIQRYLNEEIGVAVEEVSFQQYLVQ